MSEKELQKQCEDHLKRMQIIYRHIRNNVHNNKYRSGSDNGLIGYPDLTIFLKGGVTIFVELKTDKGCQSVEQMEYQCRIENAGFKYYLCRSFEHFKELL